MAQSDSTLIVAHDRGGAEVVSAWARKHKELGFEYCLAGPALSVVTRKHPGAVVHPPNDLERAVGKSDWVLTGTGWSSRLERDAIRLARRAGVPVVSYLDHWVNYRGRFVQGGEVVLPDEIWVGDEFALALARKAFPECVIRLEPNEYLNEMRAAVAAVSVPRKRSAGVRVLYVTEPSSAAAERLYDDPNALGYTEFEALDSYLTYLAASGEAVDTVTLRTHPSEPEGKYAEIIDRHRKELTIVESIGHSLAEDCAQADWVVGCDSMAMVVAHICGCKVFCSIPSTGPELSLPFPGIQRLFPRNV